MSGYSRGHALVIGRKVAKGSSTRIQGVLAPFMTVSKTFTQKPALDPLLIFTEHGERSTRIAHTTHEDRRR
jgi:hypothetical protein